MTDSVDTLKQRVVGAFVIISLAVIFLPMIFDEPHEQASNIIVPVPPRPAFKVIEIEKPVKPVFQKVEYDEEESKVVVTQNQVSSDDDAAADQEAPKQEAEQPAQNMEKPIASSTKAVDRKDSGPSVNHLPAFKNVWMVQLGTFSKTDNAYQLRDKLRLDGFDGHTKKIDLNGSSAIRVFTGPFLDKTQAEKIKRQLDKKYKVDSRIIFFDA